MQTFKIEIQETLARAVEVQADNLQEAFSKVKYQYEKAEIVLDYSDFDTVEFIDMGSQSKKDEINILANDLIDYLYLDEQKDFKGSGKPENHIFKKLERLKSLID